MITRIVNELGLLCDEFQDELDSEEERALWGMFSERFLNWLEEDIGDELHSQIQQTIPLSAPLTVTSFLESQDFNRSQALKVVDGLANE